MRNCPGKKFAQVEFVAVMARLFRDHKVEPVRKGRESEGEALNRVKDVVGDSWVGLLLEMPRIKEVAVRWQKR